MPPLRWARCPIRCSTASPRCRVPSVGSGRRPFRRSPPSTDTPSAPACSSPWPATSASSPRARRSGCSSSATACFPTSATAYLPGIVGEGRARELIFTARTVDADEAARIGLANEVVPAEELEVHAAVLAQAVGEAPPLVLRHTKAALAVSADVDANFEHVRIGQAECLRALISEAAPA